MLNLIRGGKLRSIMSTDLNKLNQEAKLFLVQKSRWEILTKGRAVSRGGIVVDGLLPWHKALSSSLGSIILESKYVSSEYEQASFQYSALDLQRRVSCSPHGRCSE